ncbi:TPA: biotin transporter BioY [Vibrio parahaemolyticus]|nr:biotin transporter BioY [Vibrio parahaemolyticus]HBC3383591.1 biotin transporter BioY [Vibrio parahaemolyticus]HBC3445581.1 biotin transporter BioY [Vibrio parahaemolyticus]HBC3845399.1 biotin transporter BioY [Vibrio parahaemolyticus]HBH7861978.1 biotin transporter BioY [Vibrio parahaemolyticus]
MEKNIAYTALFAALIAVLGLVPKITLDFGIPITAQSLGIMLCGTILGSKRGGQAVLLFLLLVALGLPLLSGGNGGLGAFFGATGGFLIGWPVSAFISGFIMERWHKGSIVVVATIASLIGGICALYFFGVIGMSIVLKKTVLDCAALVLVFIPGDIIKAVIAGLLTSAVAKARPASILSRPTPINS